MNLQEAARNYERNVSQYLQQMLRAGSANVLNPQGIGQTRQAGSNTLMYGTTPTQTQVKQWIASHGGNPYTRELMAQGNRRVTRRENALALNRAGAQEQSTLQQFIDQAQARYDEANAANKERYADILRRLEDRYDRNMARVDNWGRAAEGDARERAEEAFGNVQANLSARGLGNATIADAFRQRNQRDLDRNLQQISERRDARAAEYDQALSKDVTDFMAARYDNAPRMSDVIQLAQLQAQRGPQAAMTPNSADRRTVVNYNYAPPQAPMIGGVSPAAALAMTAGMQAQLSPLYAAAYGPRIGYVPNQYSLRDRRNVGVAPPAPVPTATTAPMGPMGPMGPLPADSGPSLPEYPAELMPPTKDDWWDRMGQLQRDIGGGMNNLPLTTGYPSVDAASVGGLMGAYGMGVGPAAGIAGNIAGNMVQAEQMDGTPTPAPPPAYRRDPVTRPAPSNPMRMGYPAVDAGSLGGLMGAYGSGAGGAVGLAANIAGNMAMAEQMDAYRPQQEEGNYTLPIPIMPLPIRGTGSQTPPPTPRPPLLPPASWIEGEWYVPKRLQGPRPSIPMLRGLSPLPSAAMADDFINTYRVVPNGMRRSN